MQMTSFVARLPSRAYSRRRPHTAALILHRSDGQVGSDRPWVSVPRVRSHVACDNTSTDATRKRAHAHSDSLLAPNSGSGQLMMSRDDTLSKIPIRRTIYWYAVYTVQQLRVVNKLYIYGQPATHELKAEACEAKATLSIPFFRQIPGLDVAN
eukprot:1733891-Pleurochrysis_carterae.AAC.2